MKKIHSLSFKVPIIISSIIFITIVTLASISIWSSSRAIRKAALEGFSATVSGYSHMIDMVLHEQKLAIATYAQSGTLANGITGIDDPVLKNEALKRLKDFASVNTYAINIGLADMNGKVLFDSSNPKLVGASIAEIHKHLFSFMKANNYKFSFDNYTSISSTTGGQALLLCGGVKNSQGDFVGLVYINLDLGKVNKDFIGNLNINGRITVANRDGNIILSSDSKRIGGNLPDVYSIIKTSNEGIIESFDYEGHEGKRSAAYKNVSLMPWAVIFAKSDSEIYKEIKYTILRTVIIGPLFIILCTILIFMYIKSITKPLDELVLISREISNGDLTSTHRNIKRKDELGVLANSFFDMRDRLSDIIIKVRTSADEIRINAKELSSGSVDLSKRTEAQAASLEETASSMEQMASTIKSSADQSIEGNKMMIDSREAIQNAGEIILDTTKNIEEVYDASTKIKDITKIIEDIAFQTNILALNAAVEAARAGDMGKGFAVVASEVRNLAQTTQSSVKDITHLVDNAYEKINKATESARVSQDIFSELQGKIENTAKIMQDISSTAVEQHEGVEQVNRAVTDMDTVTQQNAALVEQVSASSTSLLNQAEELVNAMSFFKV
ncbi:chemotaxis protein [Brachyspira hyodysenteriae]|uniref:methyl-accepting chemotaxis protein n=1 Tax=Brachyspira hyodysenteriae TaxID=159 RepID=UPI00063DD3D6|nr:methyl-accepting chemotaxis protein [Brachyspira hyodysenteriae]KLI27484.1 chemotaxis protein [Brachyspira hyodysenteriae]TVL76761.1 chemotaxis protein [Brachyspira hyodysenteriae]TVL85600.1 chemotaxis protein [Brachyspira hyodysenteriae]